MKRLGKRGMQFNVWLAVVVGIGGGIMAIAVLAIVLAAFKTGTTDPNATLIIGYGQQFLANTTSQLPTVGTVAGVLLLVGLIALAGFGAYGFYKSHK